ncbi:MAG: CoA-binding protein [Bacteroidota bacterium]
MNKKKTLVLGASAKTNRYSNIAIHRLRGAGHPVEAIGLRPAEVADVQVHRKEEVILPEDIDTVTLYLNPVRQEAYKNMILDLQPKRVIFNPGTENPVFERELEDAGIQALEACTLVMLSTGQY